MLKEIISGIPINRQFTMQEWQENLAQDSVIEIREATGIDVIRNASSLTSSDVEKIIPVAKNIYGKILENSFLNSEIKVFTANLILCKIFELWKQSAMPALFFIKIRQVFTIPQIIAALETFMTIPANQTWVLNFFHENKSIFPHKNNKIHTIALYYPRIYSGGIEKYISLIIPIYIQMGYRVILFNEEYKPEAEYSLPPVSDLFKRVIIKSPQKILERLNEFEKLLKEYEVDLFICQDQVTYLIPPQFKILFLKLSGLKAGMHFHESILLHLAIIPSRHHLFYRLADFLVTLSNPFQRYWQNFGIRTYYVPNPVKIEGAENFHGRDPKKNSNTILYVGRIAVALDKNTFAILSILNEVVKTIPSAKLKIVGEVTNEEVFIEMKKFIAANHLENNVEFCGYHKDVAPFYESADVMLSTSKAEGWGLSITESKFYELPLVAYELPDSELLRGGKGCEIVKQDDYKAAARAVVKILTDTEYRCKLSAEARESLQPFIDYDIVGAWKRIFDDLDNDSPVPPYDIENEKIQTFILNELLEQKLQVRKLSAQLKNVHLGIT